MSHRQLSRRRFLQGLGGGGTALAAGLLAACGGPELTPAPVRAAAPDLSRAERVVDFGNWFEYTDTVGAGQHIRHPTLDEFTRRTGIRVNYSEPIQGNQQIVGQIGIALALGRFTGYDLLVISDWYVPPLIEAGWLQRVEPGTLPNAGRLLPQFRDHPLPDVARYSLPWQGGFTGLAWNEKLTRRPVLSMTDLLTSRDLHGKVGLLAEMRDVIGLILLDMGVDPAAFTDAEFRAAIARVNRAVVTGQIRSVTNDYVPLLIKGKLAACAAWPSDITFEQPQYPFLQTALPTAGGGLWTDNMVIPAFARHKRNAEALMNFYYEPGIAAQLSAYEQYISPVLGARAVMRRIDPALVTDPYVFPSPQMLARGHYFRILTPAQGARYESAYATTVGL